MNRIIRYLYLVAAIFLIRFIFGLLKIFDMSIEGFLGSILTGLVLLFLMETIDFYFHHKKENETIVRYVEMKKIK